MREVLVFPYSRIPDSMKVPRRPWAYESSRDPKARGVPYIQGQDLSRDSSHKMIIGRGVLTPTRAAQYYEYNADGEKMQGVSGGFCEQQHQVFASGSHHFGMGFGNEAGISHPPVE